MPPVTTPSVSVVVDADLCLPAEVAAAAGIRVAPPEVPLLTERINIPRLALEAGGEVDPAPVVEACLAAAAAGARTVVYVPAQDGYGSPSGAAEAARTALEPLGVTLEVFETGEGLMSAGWRAVLLAEALRAGEPLPEAMARARAVTAAALALVEHPELAVIPGPDGTGTTHRLVTSVHGPDFRLVAAPARRDDGLRAVRDGFAQATAEARGRLRVAVLHGGVVPAGEAMATWIARQRPDAEVVDTAITHHQGTRLGPGFVAVCWVEERAAGAEG
ncbi:MAG: hypothetical protein Q7K37_07610 [Dehalococcoidia bacterium]|nr:hypothetical protein [Dehalococcoidia bacterium]